MSVLTNQSNAYGFHLKQTKAIKDGFKKIRPAKDYDNLYYSALARAKADWLVGLNVTRTDSEISR